MPLERFDAEIQTAKPDLVVSSAQQMAAAASLYEVARFLQEQKIRLAFGGLIFNLLPDLPSRIPGYFLGESLSGAVDSVEQLMTEKPEIQGLLPVPEQYRAAAEHFKEMQPVIAADLWSEFQRNGIREQHLEAANRFLGQDIQAGLILGDLNLLRHEIDWLEGLLKSHNIPLEYLPKYLELYRQAVDENLDERGQLIKDWLNSVISREFV